ncbi:MAG: class I SAM-dependent methyltransferase [Acidiferrobacterales bacterium]
MSRLPYPVRLWLQLPSPQQREGIVVDPEQIKQATTAVFNKVAEGYDHPYSRYFPFAADKILFLLKPRRGDKILDIATGTGVVATTLAKAIEPGRVHAIDLSEGMLDQLEKSMEKQGLTNIDVHVMDAESLEFRKEYFDTVVCSFGLFFLADMLAALKEWVRVIKPGGSIMFTSFGPNAFQPMTRLMLDRLEDYGVEVPKDRTKMGWYKLATPEQGTALMQQTGLTDINVVSKQLGFHLSSATEWWEAVWNAGFRGLVDQVPEDKIDQFRKEHLDEVDKLKAKDGIWLDAEVLFFKATKPA